MALWTGCVAGALEEQEFAGLLREVGFENPSLEPTRIYSADDAAALLAGTGLDIEIHAKEVEGKVISAFVRATKPAAAALEAKAAAAVAAKGAKAEKSCCGPECCN